MMTTLLTDRSAIGLAPDERLDGTTPEALFELWCRFTGNDPARYGIDEREAFVARPQVSRLCTLRPQRLIEAGQRSVRRGSLPLERWLGAVTAVN